MKSRAEPKEQFANLLLELAKLLLDQGVTLNEFRATAEGAFIKAASEKARLRNTRVNKSALAALTGLTRGQVRQILGNQRGNSLAGDRISQTLNGWETDTEFSSHNGRARCLPLRGSKGSFERLTKRYGGDVTPRVLRLELQRLGKAKVTADRICPVFDAAPKPGARNLENLASALSKALRSPRDAAQKIELKAVCMESTYEALSRKANAVLRRRAAQGMQAFIADLQTAAVAAADFQTRRRSSKKMSKLSVLLITQD